MLFPSEEKAALAYFAPEGDHIRTDWSPAGLSWLKGTPLAGFAGPFARNSWSELARRSASWR